MKHIPYRLLALLSAITLLFSLIGCGKEEPGLTDDQAQKILETLLPKSNEMMHIIYGEGLQAQEHTLSNDQVNVQYEPIVKGQGYESIAAMKTAMEQIFSASYRVELYTLMFDGYTEPTATETAETKADSNTLTSTIYPRYKEEDGVLKINVKYLPLTVSATPAASGAKVVGGDSERVTVELAYTSSDGKSGNMKITLACDNGTWLIDGPTY